MTTPLLEHFYSDLCPSCGRTMRHVRTIRRGLEAPSEVLECRQCGVTVTQVIESGKDRGESPEPLH